MAGFLGEADAVTFASELWDMLLDAQDRPGGIPKRLLDDKKEEMAREAKGRRRSLEAMGGGQQPAGIDSGYVIHLQSQLSKLKSMQTMGVLDSQIGMVKRS
jgi:hypothetical protein